MFFFQRQFKEIREVKIRDEWGILHRIVIVSDASHLTDKQLADLLKVGVNTVITHRRD